MQWCIAFYWGKTQMIKLRKVIAYFTLYNVISILVIALAMTTYEKETNIDYNGLVAGAYLGVGILSIMMALAVLAINEIHK
jgi:hypothetical protein